VPLPLNIEFDVMRISVMFVFSVFAAQSSAILHFALISFFWTPFF